jgi:hypothetical protein
MKTILIYISIGLIGIMVSSCAEGYHNAGPKSHKKVPHVNSASAHNAKAATHSQKAGTSSSTEKQKAKIHHKGGGAKFKFY